MRTLGKTLIIFLPLLIVIIPFSCKNRYTDNFDTNEQLYMNNVNIESENDLQNADRRFDFIVVDTLNTNNPQGSGCLKNDID